MRPITDIHTHVVPSHFPAFVADAPSPIEMRGSCNCGRADVFIDGKMFRTVTDECWDTDRRLETMNRIGIGRQLLSPMPELLSHWRPLTETLAIAEHVNASLAAMVERAPPRFAALGMVPLQDPEAAIRTLQGLMAQPGFCGVEIGTNIDGLPLGDARFAPFFAEAERLGAAVFVHPVRPVAGYRLDGPAVLGTLAAFPCEIALAAVSLIAGGVLTRHKRLRLAFSHGGGALGLLLPRLDNGWATLPAFAQTVAECPSEQARRLYYDTLVYDGPTLSFLIERFGKTQLCIGSDLPFAVAEKDPVGRLTALGLAGADMELLLSENAARFAGL